MEDVFGLRVDSTSTVHFLNELLQAKGREDLAHPGKDNLQRSLHSSRVRFGDSVDMVISMSTFILRGFSFASCLGDLLNHLCPAEIPGQKLQFYGETSKKLVSPLVKVVFRAGQHYSSSFFPFF